MADGGGGVLNPPLSTVGWLKVGCSTVGWLQKPKKVKKAKKSSKKKQKYKKIVSLQANISDTPFDQKFFQPPEVGVSQWHTHTDGHTYKHCGLLPESDSGRFCKNIILK